MSKNVMVGVVTGDKTAKTRRVEIPRMVRHPKYGKYIRKVSWLLLNNFAWRMEMKWASITRRPAIYEPRPAAEIREITEASEFLPGVSRRVR